MSEAPEGTRLKLLERLDLILAGRLSEVLDGAGAAEDLAARQARVVALHSADWPRWIAGALGLRGLRVDEAAVAGVLRGRHDRLATDSQEARLVRGLRKGLEVVHARGASGLLPNGWTVVEMFRQLVGEFPKFHNNHLRQDVPWDAIAFVSYPDASLIAGLLDTFTPVNRYRDMPSIFDALHPVRRAFRLLWRLARIAPFPDYNLLMAFVAMNAYLLANGYPCVFAEPTDREMLTTAVAGPPPLRIVQFELRMIERLAPGAGKLVD